MGIADTGHDWAMTSTALTGQWVVRGGVARLIAATSGVTHLASVFVGYSDLRVSARITIGAGVTSFGVGLLFRVLGKSAGDWDGLFFSYAGGTTWHIGRIIDGGTPSLSSVKRAANTPQPWFSTRKAGVGGVRISTSLSS